MGKLQRRNSKSWGIGSRLKLVGWLLLTLSSLLLFQNCEDVKSESGFTDPSLTQFQGAYGKLNQKVIWSLNNLYVSKRDISLYVNPALYKEGSVFSWHYILDGRNQGCQISQDPLYPSYIDLYCVQGGSLRVFLSVIHPDSRTEQVAFSATVESAKFFIKRPSDAEVYISEEEVVVNKDGTPGFALAALE